MGQALTSLLNADIVCDFANSRYIKLVRKYGLEISQPGLDPSRGSSSWEMTKRRSDQDVHM